MRQSVSETPMNLTATSRLGCTLVQGSTMSGTSYASYSKRHQRTSAWMELVCFDGFPRVPSLSGTMVQGRQDLLSATKGSGEPSATIHMEFELFDDESPKTCANFRNLCSGHSTSRQGHTYVYQGLTPSYRGTYFHKIIPQLCVQGGDLTMRVDKGANHFSSFGRGWFSDEYKRRRINEVGLLLMANNGPNSNGSQFFVTTTEDAEKPLTGRYTCFGRVVKGLEDFMREVAPFGDSNGYPSRFVIITECGSGSLAGSLGTSWALPESECAVAADGQAADEEKEKEEIDKEEREEREEREKEAPGAVSAGSERKAHHVTFAGAE